MKLLHTSDWHLGKSLYDFSMIEDQEHFLCWLLRVIEEEHIDAVLLAGDIYDRPVPSAEAVRLLDIFLSGAALRLKVPVLAIAGNHDSGARLEFASSLLERGGCHISGRLRAEIRRVTLDDKYGPVNFYLLPWLFPADVRSLLPGSGAKSFSDAYRAVVDYNLPLIDQGARSVILSHGFFTAGGRSVVTSDSEISVGGMDVVDAGVFAPFGYAALGHLHAPQEVGAGNIRYSGSPLKYSLSEERQRKSVSIVELDKAGRVTVAELPVPALSDVRTVRGSFSELMEPSFHQNRSFGDYVFAEITDLGAIYPVEKLRVLFPKLLGVRFPTLDEADDGTIREVNAHREKLSVTEHFANFYRAMKNEEMPEGQLKLLAEIIGRMEREEGGDTAQ